MTKFKFITILAVIAYNTSKGVIRLLLRVIAKEYLLQRLWNEHLIDLWTLIAITKIIFITLIAITTDLWQPILVRMTTFTCAFINFSVIAITINKLLTLLVRNHPGLPHVKYWYKLHFTISPSPCRYDEDKNKFINLEELKLMMEKLGAPQTHLSLKNMMKEVDEDQDNQMNFREVYVLEFTVPGLLFGNIWLILTEVHEKQKV